MMKSPVDDSLVSFGRNTVCQEDGIPFETDMRHREIVVDVLYLQDEKRRWMTSRVYECARDSRYEESETQNINCFILEDFERRTRLEKKLQCEFKKTLDICIFPDFFSSFFSILFDLSCSQIP